jgi:hypothetical protein
MEEKGGRHRCIGHVSRKPDKRNFLSSSEKGCRAGEAGTKVKYVL